jgi:hypothetical protein
VLPEDIPDEIASLLPGIAFVARLSVVAGAPKTALARAKLVAKRVAGACHGVVFDPQADTVATPSGIKRFSAPKRDALHSITSLSWWTLNEAVCSPVG